jgi:RNA polymerase sigma factor (sigma-70 family)
VSGRKDWLSGKAGFIGRLVGALFLWRGRPNFATLPRTAYGPLHWGIPVSSSNLEIAQLLEQLAGNDAERGWRGFLSAYSDAIYTAVRLIARDADDASDCYLFSCEKLAEQNFRRLRAFRPEGRASFTTWLRAVVRNLALDWYRAKFGRTRLFARVARASAVDQQIYRALFERRLSLTEAWHGMWSAGTALTFAQFEDRVEAIRQMLSSRQLWLLSTANVSTEAIDVAPSSPGSDFPDAAPDPETLAVMRDIQHKVRNALRDLDDADRLLLRLRYDEDLGLREISAIVGLKDAQTADRRIREALSRLRKNLGVAQSLSGKIRSASV